MTSVEAQRLEELACLAHRHWTLAVRTVLGATEPFFRGAKRTPENQETWAQLDRLLLLSTKKWECLRGAERLLPLANAEAIVRLLHDLGELKE